MSVARKDHSCVQKNCSSCKTVQLWNTKNKLKTQKQHSGGEFPSVSRHISKAYQIRVSRDTTRLGIQMKSAHIWTRSQLYSILLLMMGNFADICMLVCWATVCSRHCQSPASIQFCTHLHNRNGNTASTQPSASESRKCLKGVLFEAPVLTSAFQETVSLQAEGSYEHLWPSVYLCGPGGLHHACSSPAHRTKTLRTAWYANSRAV